MRNILLNELRGYIHRAGLADAHDAQEPILDALDTIRELLEDEWIPGLGFLLVQRVIEEHQGRGAQRTYRATTQKPIS